MANLLKISKSKGNFKVNDVEIFTSDFHSEVKKVNSIVNGRPSLTRDTNETFVETNLYLNKEVLEGLLRFKIDEEKLNHEIENGGPEYYSMGRSNAWTSKAVGALLNEVVGESLFVDYN